MSWTMTKKPHSLGGIQKLYKFSNGLILSAIKTDFSYGNRRHMGEQGLWEIAVLTNKFGEWKTRDIFPDADDDVIGWLTDDDLTNCLDAVDKASILI